MPERTLDRQITVDMVHNALNLWTLPPMGYTVEGPEPACDWPRLCHENFCRFPRYLRDGEPNGLVACLLIELGYPLDLLKDLDVEYELGEVLHPGVKIGRSRNPALTRIDRPALKLLAYLQDAQKIGWSWSDIAAYAFRPRWMIARLDKRRRPWLY